MIAAAGASSSLGELVLVASSGSALTLLGVVVTQIFTDRREKQKWRREWRTARYNVERTLYLELAEWIENKQAWLQSVDHGGHAEQAELSVHFNQLSARVKMQRHLELKILWSDFVDALRTVEASVAEWRIPDQAGGHGPHHRDTIVPLASVRAELVLMVMRHLVMHETVHRHQFVEEAAFLRAEYLDDPRREQVLKDWLDEARKPGGFWQDDRAGRCDPA